ncbi:hypothetical protein H4Q26_014460 [Puccinia striiformis f. sp. tritici PST-130]|nr:hypothetical protein H4Q26_014460 [Puccinia striiformis f. sp. tritici PST-130]
MSNVRSRSSTLNPTRQSSRSSDHYDFGTSRDHFPSQSHSLNPSCRLPLEIRLPWETSHTEAVSGRRQFGTQLQSQHSHPRIAASPSLISIDHNSDASSHLTLTSEPSSNKLSKSSHWSSNSPPELELGFSFNSPSLLSGLPSSTNQPETIALLSGEIPVYRRCQKVLLTSALPEKPFQLSGHADQVSIVSSHINGASSSLSSRVRPTPPPRNNLTIRSDDQTVESLLPTGSSSHRESHLPTRSSLGDRGSAEDEVEAEEHATSDETDGASDEEDYMPTTTCQNSIQFRSRLRLHHRSATNSIRPLGPQRGHADTNGSLLTPKRLLCPSEPTKAALPRDFHPSSRLHQAITHLTLMLPALPHLVPRLDSPPVIGLEFYSFHLLHHHPQYPSDRQLLLNAAFLPRVSINSRQSTFDRTLSLNITPPSPRPPASPSARVPTAKDATPAIIVSSTTNLAPPIRESTPSSALQSALVAPPGSFPYRHQSM